MILWLGVGWAQLGWLSSTPRDISCARTFGQLVCQLGCLGPDVLTCRYRASALMPGSLSLYEVSLILMESSLGLFTKWQDSKRMTEETVGLLS